MSTCHDFLVETGCEELPPASLQILSQAFADSIERQTSEAGLTFESVKRFATPRRMAVILSNLSVTQPDRLIERKGPSLKAAYKNGEPTKAATGFAKSCGVNVEDLKTINTEKGAWLVYRIKQKGQPANELLPKIVEKALSGLPVNKKMRWGASREEFVRPLHWLVMLHGSEVIKGRLFGVESDRVTCGHRVHCPKPLTIESPGVYENLLREKGYVIASFDSRKEMVREQVISAAKKVMGQAMIDEPLLDEVTALVEWPVALTGQFDPNFLKVPTEALVSSMRTHQKYFPVTNSDGDLLPAFVCIANLESQDISQVIAGNERVIRPRLADARFFYETDLKSTLSDRREKLKSIVFQEKLGSVFDKTERIARLAGIIIQEITPDIDEKILAERAGMLSRSDLVSEMVLEFPELQGTMGRYYAKADREPESVCNALEEQYLPRFAGDRLPCSETGYALALADKLDTLAGIFGIGMLPTGNRDPFALRRAVLGVLRIMIEKRLTLDFKILTRHAVAGYLSQGIKLNNENLEKNLNNFMLERLRQWCHDQKTAPEVFLAVKEVRPESPYDFYQRMLAVNAFRELPEATSLTQANKRVANILKKSDTSIVDISINASLLVEPEEKRLASTLSSCKQEIKPQLEARDYQGVLNTLATLKLVVDNFFDQVLVNVEDEALKKNRHALLSELRQLFLKVADISYL